MLIPLADPVPIFNEKRKVCKVTVLFIQLCPTLCDPMDYRLQIPLSLEFSRQRYWSR